MNTFIRVSMDKKTMIKEDMPNEYKNSGGRLLIDRILINETDPTCDPLGKDNKLIICTGLVGGTMAPSSGRLSIGGKSPLTGGIKEANAGGIVAQQMAKLGVKAIIFEGKPEENEWFILKINKNGEQLISADEFVGLNNYELSDKLKHKYGKDIGIISIGTAGERGYFNSTLQVTSTNGYPSRAAARGGLGAVMGSKGIKAVIFDAKGPSQVEYFNREKFKEANKKFIEGIQNHPVSGQAMPALGTAVLVNPVNSLGMMPTNNFSKGCFDKAENVSGEMIAQMQGERGGRIGHACNAGCVIKCSNDYHDKDGNYLTSGMEYETIALVGPNCGIDDIDTIAKIDRMCDDLGIDTMDAGVTISVCMEAGNLDFGDCEGAIKLVQEMIDGTQFGRILGNGAYFTGKALGVKRIPAVKKQALAGYDPRALKGTGVTYATSPMGGDHTSGNAFGYPDLDPIGKERQVEVSTGLQIATATFDSLGMCIFSSFCTADPQYAQSIADMMTYLYGEEWTPDRVFELGIECLKLEKEYNRLAGFKMEDNRLPEFMYHEPLEPTGAVFDFTDEELSFAIPF